MLVKTCNDTCICPGGAGVLSIKVAGCASAAHLLRPAQIAAAIRAAAQERREAGFFCTCTVR